MKNYVLDNLRKQVQYREAHGIKNDKYDIEIYYHKIIWFSDYIFRVRNYEIPVFSGFKGVGGRSKKVYDPFDDDEIINKEVRKKTEYKIRKKVY